MRLARLRIKKQVAEGNGPIETVESELSVKPDIVYLEGDQVVVYHQYRSYGKASQGCHKYELGMSHEEAADEIDAAMNDRPPLPSGDDARGEVLDRRGNPTGVDQLTWEKLYEIAKQQSWQIVVREYEG